MIEVWKIEHADFGMGIAHQIFEESIMPGVEQGIRTIDATKKLAGFNVKQTTMYGSNCSAIYCQNKDNRLDDHYLNREDANEPPPAEIDYWRPKDVKMGEKPKQQVQKSNVLASIIKAKSKLCSHVHEKRRIETMPANIMAKMKKKLQEQKNEFEEKEL